MLLPLTNIRAKHRRYVRTYVKSLSLFFLFGRERIHASAYIFKGIGSDRYIRYEIKFYDELLC